jgi:hypothetical protein
MASSILRLAEVLSVGDFKNWIELANADIRLSVSGVLFSLL